MAIGPDEIKPPAKTRRERFISDLETKIDGALQDKMEREGRVPTPFRVFLFPKEFDDGNITVIEEIVSRYRKVGWVIKKTYEICQGEADVTLYFGRSKKELDSRKLNRGDYHRLIN